MCVIKIRVAQQKSGLNPPSEVDSPFERIFTLFQKNHVLRACFLSRGFLKDIYGVLIFLSDKYQVEEDELV
jgi:hypothetical protein